MGQQEQAKRLERDTAADTERSIDALSNHTLPLLHPFTTVICRRTRDCSRMKTRKKKKTATRK